jgi:hypothetical protein
MRTICTALLFTIISLNTASQDVEFKKPDYKWIKKIIEKEDSPYFYPNLFNRYLNADTSLNLQDVRILYFGYLFNKSYEPYPISDFTDSLHVILNKDTLNSDDWTKIIDYEKHVLEEAPFNIRDLNILSYAYQQKNDILSFLQSDLKMDMVIRAILSTGDGLKESTAWHVISISHEYDILSVLGFKFGGKQSLTNKGCDFLEVTENEHNIPGFYFDVNQILDKEGEAFK